MRSTFSRKIVEAALKDRRVLLLTGDHGYALFDDFRNAAPDQFINCGIAEQNMIGMAAGLAKAGFKPICYGLSAFVPVRVVEQIKMDICYEGLPVAIVGDGAGLVYSSLGSSHQSTEDIACARALPGLEIYSPGDALELDYTMSRILSFQKPAYIRMGKADLGSIHKTIPTNTIGDLLPVSGTSGADTVFLGTGALVGTASRLASEYRSSAVWSAPSLSPFNRLQLEEIADGASTLVTLEEHSIDAGFGSLVCEIVSEMRGAKPRIIRIGVNRRFSKYCGSYSYLLREHLLDIEGVRSQLIEKGLAPDLHATPTR